MKNECPAGQETQASSGQAPLSPVPPPIENNPLHNLPPSCLRPGPLTPPFLGSPSPAPLDTWGLCLQPHEKQGNSLSRAPLPAPTCPLLPPCPLPNQLPSPDPCPPPQPQPRLTLPGLVSSMPALYYMVVGKKNVTQKDNLLLGWKAESVVFLQGTEEFISAL